MLLTRKLCQLALALVGAVALLSAAHADPNQQFPPLDDTSGQQSQQSAPEQVDDSDSNGGQIKVPKLSHEQVERHAFNNLLHSYFPLSPKQIHEFKNRAAEQQKANARPPGPAPAKGTSNIITVNLKPGADMPVIRIGQGKITSLVFIDADGDVWPITSYSVGDPKAFNVNWDKSSGVLMVQGEKLYAQTNVSIMLKGLPIPVMMNMLVGQHSWDYLDYIRINQNQPTGKGSLQQQTPEAPRYLINVLQGLPPEGARMLQASASFVKAWSYRGKYLLLTAGDLMSPQWNSKVSGPGLKAWSAYEIPKTPVILISYNGQVHHITLQTPSVGSANNGDLGGDDMNDQGAGQQDVGQPTAQQPIDQQNSQDNQKSGQQILSGATRPQSSEQGSNQEST